MLCTISCLNDFDADLRVYVLIDCIGFDDCLVVIIFCFVGFECCLL